MTNAVGGPVVELARARRPAAMRPSSSTTIWSAIAIASSWSCVTSSVVTWTSSCRRRSHSRSSARTLASSAPNGSSSSSTRGSTASARASAIRWRWPPESWRRVALGVAGQPDDRRAARRPARATRVLRLLADRQPERDVVAHGHVLERGVVLEDEADLAPLRRHARSRRRRRSSTRPASGCSSPAMIRSSVDLPEPLGPSSAVSEPSGHLERDVVERRRSRRSAW